MAKVTKHNPKTVHAPTGYTHVARVGDIVFLAGQVGRDPAGNIKADDVEAQAVQVFENIKRCLATEGLAMADLVKVTIYITDYSFKAKVLQVKDRYLGESPPTSMFVVCSSLALPEYLVEVDAVAAARD